MTRTIETLTVGEFRRLMQYGGADTDTVADALASITASDQAMAAHETAHNAYQAYVVRRDQRRADMMSAAASEAHDRVKGGDGERMAARQQARADTFADFEARHPLLDFQAWVDAGQPDIYSGANAVQRAARKVAELVF